jgi:hypothetical protein
MNQNSPGHACGKILAFGLSLSSITEASKAEVIKRNPPERAFSIRARRECVQENEKSKFNFGVDNKIIGMLTF